MIAGIIEGALVLVGCVLILVSAVGILRMPDLFTRLQVTSKASVLGMACILSAAAIHFADPAVTTRVVVIIAFVVLTMPVATHLLARAGYANDVPLTPETVVNELAGRYDPLTHTLTGEKPKTRAFEIKPGSAVVGKRIADLGLPPGVLILAIHRAGATVVPHGQTRLESGDALEVLVEPAQLALTQAIFEAEVPASGDEPP